MIGSFTNKNIYVLAPYTDDGELGAVETLAKLAEMGANIFYFAFSTAKESVPKRFKKNILKTKIFKATNTSYLDENLEIRQKQRFGISAIF